MKYFLALLGAVVLGYVVLGEWLSEFGASLDDISDWLDADTVHVFDPFYDDIGLDPRRFNA